MSGAIIRIDTNSIRAAGRSTQGVKLLNLESDDKVAAAVVIPPEEAKTLPEEGTLLTVATSVALLPQTNRVTGLGGLPKEEDIGMVRICLWPLIRSIYGLQSSLWHTMGREGFYGRHDTTTLCPVDA